ncbi:MAG: carbon-nitrogen hydrolase family protein [Victivallales bacterium]|nr:carbon-nitrogen hydrolase family protein [Victivallales bacterium]
MSRPVTISSLGPAPMAGNADTPFDQAVEQMIAYWRGHFAQVLPDRPDLIVVPEACDRYPAMPIERRLEYYSYRGDRVRDFFAEVAAENSCYMAYSASRDMPDGTRRNSTQIIDRQGQVAGIYNKNHVVVEETTKGGILCGKDAPVIECDFGTVGCAICFDLNFAPIRERYAASQPDLIVFCSMYHGGLMQNYWAYNCRAHFVGSICNDQCTVIDPLGEQIATSTNYHHRLTTTVNLDCKLAHLDYNGGKFRAMKAKYGRGVEIKDPGHLGCVLLTSWLEDKSIDDLVAEFEIELLDDYMARALAHHAENVEP